MPPRDPESVVAAAGSSSSSAAPESSVNVFMRNHENTMPGYLATSIANALDRLEEQYGFYDGEAEEQIELTYGVT